MDIEMTYFADKAPNKLTENRSAFLTPNASIMAKCFRLTTSGQCTREPFKSAYDCDKLPTTGFSDDDSVGLDAAGYPCG